MFALLLALDVPCKDAKITLPVINHATIGRLPRIKIAVTSIRHTRDALLLLLTPLLRIPRVPLDFGGVSAAVPSGYGFFCIPKMPFMTPELRATPTTDVQGKTI